MPRQAVLFTPGDEEEMIQKSLAGDADMVVLDIEDSVAPAAKPEAGETIRDVLNSLDPAEIAVEVSVRINPLSTRGVEDLSTIAAASEYIDDIVLPKVTSAATIEDLADELERLSFEADIAPIIENPQAILHLEEIASHPRVVALEFGAEDYTTEIGGIHTDERSEVVYARQKIVAAAAAADIDAIDLTYPDFQDLEGLRRNAETAARYGYDGKTAIHPAQVEVIHEAFRPDEEQVEWARKVVEAAEEAKAEGKVVFQLEGEMVDPPIIDRAVDIVERTPDEGA